MLDICDIKGSYLPIPETRVKVSPVTSPAVLTQYALGKIISHPPSLICLQAFDMQRDLQITPRRLEYTREKEGELFTSLMAIANRKQEEMKDMIVETLGSMKELLLEDAANLEFTGQLWLWSTLDRNHTRTEVRVQLSADAGSGFQLGSSS